MTEKKTMKLEMSKILSGLAALRALDGYDDLDSKGGHIRRAYKFNKPAVSRQIVRNLRTFGAMQEEHEAVRQDLVKRHRPEGAEYINAEKHPREFEEFRLAFLETLKVVEEVEVFPITFDDLGDNPIPVTVQDILEQVGILVDTA